MHFRPLPMLAGMLSNRVALTIAVALLPAIASATDPIAIGNITDLSYRGGYYIFEITNGGTNSCAPCPADPGAMASGQNCWIAETQTAQLAMLLSAHAQGLRLSGRVVSIASNCSVYQMTVADS